MASEELHPLHRMFIIAVVLTTVAEMFYLVVWGIFLFPDGSLPGKVVWTLTCGIAMGLVIGSVTYLWVEDRFHGGEAVLGAALVMAAVDSYCTWLCSVIDVRIGYFGGAERSTLFILSGVVPSVLGGLVYGWFVYGQKVSVDSETV